MHRTVKTYRMLIIDEIGYLPMNREHRGAQQSLLGRWGQTFAMASTLTAAPLDRLLHPLAHRAHCRGEAIARSINHRDAYCAPFSRQQ